MKMRSLKKSKPTQTGELPKLSFLDPKTYSGFDLFEISPFFKCKKSNEPFDIFLKMFPKHPQ
jgi:hypothetical protein